MGIKDRSQDNFVKLKVLGADRRTNNIIPFICENVKTDIHNPTRVYTDGFPVYEILEDHGLFFFLILFCQAIF